MIQAVLVFNNYGKPRLMKFYSHTPEAEQQRILAETFETVSRRPSGTCNFVEKAGSMGDGRKIMFRHFTTMYFAFCCDASESELAILDLIQVYVEALDRCFKNVCELDLIFHPDQAHALLDEVVLGGIVLETDRTEVVARYKEQLELEAEEKRMPAVPSLRDLKMPDIAFAVKDIIGNK